MRITGDTILKNYAIDSYKAVEYGYNEVEKEKYLKGQQEALRSGAGVTMTYFPRGLMINKGGTIIEISTLSYYGDFRNTFDQILSTFKFTPETQADSITVLSPNGGEVLKAGQKYEVRWKANGVDKVYISLVSGGKEFGQFNPLGIPALEGRYLWTIPDMSGWVESGLDPNSFKIFINNNSLTNDIRDFSDGTFTIIK